MTGVRTRDMISMHLDLQTDINAYIQSTHTLPISNLVIHPPRALTTRLHKQTHLQPPLSHNT